MVFSFLQAVAQLQKGAEVEALEAKVLADRKLLAQEHTEFQEQTLLQSASFNEECRRQRADLEVWPLHLLTLPNLLLLLINSWPFN